MKIKNYTSNIPVERSIMAIEKLLMDFNCTHIAKIINKGRVEGFIFQIIDDQRGPISFKLPVKQIAVQRIFEGKIKRPHKGTQNRVIDQAERTAWKILHDWVEIQLTMVALEQAESIQIFLPYAYDFNEQKTLFEKYKDGGFKLLT